MKRILAGLVLLAMSFGALPQAYQGFPASRITGTVGAAQGGTGVANNAAATLTRSGNYGLTLTLTGVTSLTLPTSGTLATKQGTTTNDDACTGCVGEIMECSGSATYTTATNLCSVSLTAGQWTVYARINVGAPGSMTYGLVGISTTSGELPGGIGISYYSVGASLAAGAGVASTYFKLASTTPVYCVGVNNGSANAGCNMWAIRVR